MKVIAIAADVWQLEDRNASMSQKVSIPLSKGLLADRGRCSDEGE